MNARRFISFAAPLAIALLVSAVRADASVLVNKAFSPTSVQLGVTSGVTITLSNTSILTAANVTSLADDIATMGGKATIASPSGIATTCAGGTASIAGTVVSLTGGVIPAAADSTHPGTCTVTFNVVGASVGNGINSIAAGALVTDQGTNATAASQTLQVLTSTLAVTGSATTSQLSTATATQTFTVTNPTASAITNTTFPITFTNGGGSSAQYTMTSGSTGSCAGSVTPSSFTSTNANPSVGTATVTGLTIPANGSCTITLTLTDPVATTSVSATGTLAAAAISDDQGITNSAAVTGKSQFFNGLASLSKSFTPSTVVAGSTSRMSTVIKNTQLVALTNAAITDALPTNMTLDATPAAAYTNCGSPTLSGAGTGTLGITGATVAATTTLGTAVTASTCTIVVTVDTAGGATGSLVNNIPAANFSDTQNVAASGTATGTLTISTGALTATKAFSAGSTVRNVPVTVTLTFSNGSGSALTAGTFTDNLPQTPVAMQYYSGFTPTFTNCGASSPAVTASGGNTIVTGSNLTIPASSSCVVKFQVTLASGGYPQQTDTNTIPTANVTFTDSGSNLVHPGAQLTATLATLPAFTIKNFVGPNYSGVANQPVTVQGQIVYSPSTAGLVTDTNASATFVLNPTGQHNLKLATTPNYQFTGCPNGTSSANVTAAGNGESFVVALPTISATCTISYNVVNENTIVPPSATYGSGIDSYTSTENGGTSTSSAQSYTVTFYTTSLLLNKVFTPNSIASGGTATAQFTIDVAAVPQLGSTQANGVAFTDSLPANMAFAVSPSVTLGAGCTQGGQPTATGVIAGTTISFSNISLLAGTDCVATFNVTSNYLGNTTNTIAASALTSTSGATNTQAASASLTVVAGVALQKTFLNSAFAIGDVNYVRFLILNSSGGVLSSGTLTDNMPASLALSSLTAQPAPQGGDPAACGGSVTGTIGSSTFQLSGMSVGGASGPGSPGECVQYVQVTASSSAAPGSVVNSIPAGALDIGGQVNLTGASTPPETLNAAPNATVTQAFSPASIVQGSTSTLTITIANTGSLAAALSGVALTDTLPSGVTVAAAPNAATTCGAGTVSAVAGSATAALAGGTLAANATCTISFNVTSIAAAVYTNTLADGALATTQGATNTQTTATLTVTAAPNVTLTKTIAPAAIAPGGSAVLTLTIANTAGSADPLSAIALTDALPSGMTVAASPGASTTCPSGTLTATAGATSAILSGATLAASASCSVTLNVTATTPGSYTNTIAAGALTSTQGASNGAAATATLSVLSLSLAQAFAPASIGAGATSVLTITIPNTVTGAVALTGVALTDALPSGVTVASTPNASTTCGSGTVTATAGGSSVALAGGTLGAGATCTISVTVTGLVAAVYANTIAAGALTTTQGISNASASTANLTITNNGITLATTFTPASITAGGSSLLTITIPNTVAGAIALSGMALTDTLPSGVTIAATPAAATTCAGTVTAVAGGSSVALAAGSVAAGATCTITVNVTGTVASTYTNTIAANALTTTQNISNPAAATATLTIVPGSVTVTKAFAPATISAGGVSVLTITLPNTAVGAIALSGAALTDTLPSGVVVAATPNASTTCGAGTATAVAGGSTVALSAGTIAASATCTVVVNVTSSVAGGYTNTIAAGSLSTTQSISNPVPATANLTVGLNGITLAQAFAPSSIGAGGTSVLTITIPNTATGSVALTSVALTDALPSGVTIASTPNASTTCGAGSVTATAGGGSIALSGGSLGANATCTISVNVTSSIASTYTNTIAAGALTTAQSVTNAAPASASLTVGLNGITLAQAFAPSSIGAGGTSVLTITIPNTATGAVALTSVALTDALPSGVTVASTPNASTTCGGSVTATAGGGSVVLAGGSLAASATCTISVNVTGTVASTYTNTIAAGALTTTQSVTNSAPVSASLTITLVPTVLSEAFTPSSIGAGATSTLTITIPNNAPGAVALTNMTLSDALPPGLTIGATPDATTTCGAGTATAVAGGASVALGGGTLAAGASCTIAVTVTGTTAGAFTNVIPAGALTTTQAVTNAAPANATLTVTLNAIAIGKAFAPASIPAGGISTLTITIPNTAPGAVALTALGLADTMPAGVTIASVPAASTTCGGALTAAAGSSSVSLTGGSVGAAASCTIVVNVTSIALGAHVNTIASSALSDTQTVTNSAPASATLTVTSALPVTLAKSFAPASVAFGGTSVLTVTLANTAGGAAALSGVGLADAFPTGMTVAAVPNASTTCSSGTVTAVAGATSFTLAGAALAANATCTMTVTVNGATPGPLTNTIAAGTLTSTQGASNAVAASATLTVASSPVSIAQAFVPASIVSGATSVLTITFANTAPGASALTALALGDILPAGVNIASVPNAATTCASGALAAAPGSAFFGLSNASLGANATCTMSVTVTSVTVGVATNTIAAGAVTSTQGVSNALPATATLTVAAAPSVTLAKSFVPASIPLGGTSVLTVSLANTAVGAAALTGVGLADAFPSGMTVAAVPNAATTCSSGTATAVAGGTSLTLAGAALAANATCTVTVAVTSTTPGSPTNTIAAGALTSAQGASNTVAASSTLTVVSAPVTIAAAFAPASIVSGATSVLTITFANTAPGASALTALALSDALPAGVKIANVPNAATTCSGGVPAAVAGSAVFALSNASLGANATCTMSATVTSSTIGVATNTIAAGALSSAQGVSNALPATATLTVGAAPSVTLAQAYAPATIGVGGVSVYTITIANTAPGAVALSAIALADPFPQGTLVAPVPNASTTCAGGAVTAAAGATLMSLGAATLAANASCTISVNVTGPAVGTYVNTIAAHVLSSAQGASNAAATQATLTIASVALQVSKTSDAAATGVAPGGTVTYTIVVKNTGAVAETHATVADRLANATFVPGSLTVNGAAAPDSVLLASTPFGSIAPGASATLVYGALVATTAVPGTSLSNSVSVNGDLPCAGATCTASALPVAVVAPVLSIVITIDGQQTETVVPGQVVTYAMTVTNTSSVTATSVNLVNTAPNGAVPIAGTVTLGGVPFAVARSARVSQSASSVNGQVVTVPIGTLAAGANVVVTFQATIQMLETNRLVDSASVGANGLPSVVVSNEVAAVMVAGALRITKTASASVATVGDRVNYLITVATPTGAALGATTIVDTLPPYEAYAPGSARVAGAALEPAIAGRVLTWTLPALTASTTISYATAITAGAQPQSLLTNAVDASAAGLRGAPASSGRASATVQIVGTTFGSCYPITGRVFVDVHDSGRFAPGDRGVSGVRIVMEDGESVVTDAEGRYDFPCVAQGMHALRLDTASLPAGIGAFDDRRLDSTRSTRRLVHAALDATILQDINFAVRPPPAP